MEEVDKGKKVKKVSFRKKRERGRNVKKVKKETKGKGQKSRKR